MATVDLDALAAELRAAGYFAEDTHGDGLLKVGTNTHERYTAHCVVSREGDVHPSRNSKVDWTALDIIRRHVSPELSRRAAVDTEAVMKLVEQYGNAREDQVIAWEVGTMAQADYRGQLAANAIAAIRAMLESHDGAIEASGRVTVDRARFERLIDAANMAADEWGAESRVGLQPGDLDPLP